MILQEKSFGLLYKYKEERPAENMRNRATASGRKRPNRMKRRSILLSELEIQVRCKDETEEYPELSLYEAAGNCMNRRIEKSGLVSVNDHGGTEELRNPVEALHLWKDVASVLLEGGEDGKGTGVGRNIYRHGWRTRGKDRDPGIFR